MTVTTAAALKAAFLEQDPAEYNVDLIDTLDASVGISGVTATADELNNLDGPEAGTVTASKAIVVGANKNIDTLVIAASGLKIGSGAGTAVTSTAAELNTLAGVSAGTTTASKALVVGANKNLDVLALPVSGLKIGAGAGTAVDATAAELNLLSGAGAAVASGTQEANIADLVIAYSSNDPSITPDGTVTFSDGSSPTVGELLEAIEELAAIQNLILDALLAFGLIAAP